MLERIRVIAVGSCIFWMLLLPFDYHYFDWFFKTIQSPVFNGLRVIDHQLIFETDTYGTYLLTILSVLLGAAVTPITILLLKKYELKTVEVLKTILAGILFFFLFKYGWNKVVKLQFYLPEPNIAYSPLGKLSKDIAYWSVVGSSYSYTVILGIVELLVAIMLLFKRTQFLGSILAIGVFAQVVLVNFSFDISVKLLALSLLIFSIAYSCCFAVQWKNVFGFPALVVLKQDSAKKLMLKWSFVVLVVLEVSVSSFVAMNFNDDKTPRLPHHGAYEVKGSEQIKRVFIHRHQFLIVETTNGNFSDYPIDISNRNEYVTRNREMICNWKRRELIVLQDTFKLKLIPYKELPLFENSFHWTSDEFH